MRKDLLRTLFSRMLATYIAVALGLILLVSATVVSLFRVQSFRNEKSRLVNETKNLVDIETSWLLGKKTDQEYRNEVEALARINDAYIEVIDLSGDRLLFYTSNKWKALAERDISKEDIHLLILDATNGESISSKRYASALDFPVISRIAMINDHDGSATHVLMFFFDTSEDQETLGAFALEILLVLLIGTFIAVVAVYYTTSGIIKPFRQVNDIVQQYSKGDYNVRIPISDIEEATQLALSFNNMADQLNDLEATRQSFVANVSHELRSPLTSMRGFLEAMEDGTIQQEDYPKYLDIVLSETKRMTSMVNDLLDLARIESGRTSIQLEVFDINELIRRVLITFEARIYDRKMDMEIKFAQEQCYVEADNAQISQVLRNLIDNAIKYSPEESRLRISTYSLRREVYVSVQDSGRGIPEEDLPYIFDRFYKVEKAHTRTNQSGTGLGLSIVKKIMDQHGQRITVKSTKGKGTTFTFTLKRASNPKKQQLNPEGEKQNEQ